MGRPLLSITLTRRAAMLTVDVPCCATTDEESEAWADVMAALPAALNGSRTIDARDLGYKLARYAAAVGDAKNHGNHDKPVHGTRVHTHVLAMLEHAVRILRTVERASGAGL